MKKALMLVLVAALGFGGGILIPRAEAKMQCDSMSYKKATDENGGTVCVDPGEDCVICYDVIDVPG